MAAVAGSLFVLMSLVAASAAASAQHAGTARIRSSAHGLTPRYVVRPYTGTNLTRTGQAATTAALKTWSSKIKSPNGTTYPFTMVGRSPRTTLTNATTTVKTPVVPVILNFKNGPTFDPTVVSNNCETASALTRTVKSPIFASVDYQPGGTDVGTTQYIDAYQRANLYKYTNPAGVNPDYHVLLKKLVQAPVSVTVPLADWATFGSGCSLLGAIDINWWDPYVQNTLIPALAAAGFGTNTLPLFLFHNAVMYDGNPNNCCILGYHSAFDFGGGVQTYTTADFDNSSEFGPGVQDVSALAHEVGEWLDDPYVNNATPAWGHIGQVSGCQDNLENGDPLTGTNLTVRVNGFNYHPQELVFYEWFYEKATSTAVNGWFSFNNTFTSTSVPCT